MFTTLQVITRFLWDKNMKPTKMKNTRKKEHHSSELNDQLSIVSEPSFEDLNLVKKMFIEHKDEEFVYLQNIYLYDVFYHANFSSLHIMKIENNIVGSLYAAKYLFNSGYIGGVLIHRKYRRKGIGTLLLKNALKRLKTPHTFLFVEPENTAAQKLFRKCGFKILYRRAICQGVYKPSKAHEDIRTYVNLNELSETIGFNKRQGIIHLGYYPIKLNEKTLKTLENQDKVLNYKSTTLIYELSKIVKIGEYKFTFNNYILKEIKNKIPLTIMGNVIEINPFHKKLVKKDFCKLLEHLRHLYGNIQMYVLTYENDPTIKVLKELGFKYRLGAYIMCTTNTTL